MKQDDIIVKKENKKYSVTAGTKVWTQNGNKYTKFEIEQRYSLVYKKGFSVFALLW